MELIVDEGHPGTPESLWEGSSRLQRLPELRLPTVARVVVVAPHPDDEVFGAAGLMQELAGRGAEVVVVGVTDGEGSHPGVPGIVPLRARERELALARLGLGDAHVVRLGLPDGAVASRLSGLTGALRRFLRHDDLCVAPWHHDGHPDHDAAGAAAMEACAETGSPLLQYLVWAWHWVQPDDQAIPWRRCGRLSMSRGAADRKRWSAQAFGSQLRVSADAPRREPVLPDPVLKRLLRRHETFVDIGSS